MFDSIAGLPFHPLIVHATVVAVPTAAVAVLGSALVPRFRRWAGILPLAITLIAVVLDPISTSSGEALEERVGHSDLVEKHSHLADGLLPWLIFLLVAAVAVTWVWWRDRAGDAAGRVGRVTVAVVAVLAVAAAVGTTQQVVRIGHSGAEAAWGDTSGS